ncbi:MFS transporter [Sphingorhabdus sp. EL138]|uniref:MFS transporter n=1 Tax=Sphingorhabdus sp. EL138 TaxID=2073156 RepID=UPI000D68AD71|nr:MFS transporter [Sphingorhabdus sp. EL138]
MRDTLRTSEGSRFIVFGSAVSAVSSLYFLVLPVVLGAAGRTGNWDETELGSIASAYLLFFTVAGAASAGFNAIFRAKLIRALPCFFLGGGFGIAALQSQNLNMVMLGHALAGIGAGALYSVSFNLVAASKNAGNGFGWKLTAEQALGASGFLLLSGLALSFAGMMAVLAAFCFLAGTILVFAPYEKIIEKAATKSSAFEHGWRFLLALAAVGIFMGALSGIWAFLEQFSTEAGVSVQAFGYIGFASLILGGGGGMAAGLLGDRFGNGKPLIFSAIILVFIIIGLATVSAIPVIGGALAFPLLWNFTMAYQLAIASNLDPANRYVGWLSPTVAGGATLGPLGAGFLLAGNATFIPLLTVTAIIAIGALMLSANLSRAAD